MAMPVSGITNATAIATGVQSTCALLSTGAVDCWGRNGFGQLGDGMNTGPESCDDGAGNYYLNFCSRVPVPVSGITNATAIAVGDADACALLGTGEVNCWGENDYGQLGNGPGIVEQCGESVYCARDPENCNSGFSFCSRVPVSVDGIADATAIMAGGGNACAWLSIGGVDCWGMNDFGQLGNGMDTGPEDCGPCSRLPVSMSEIAEPRAIASVLGRPTYTCALLVTSGINCWGENGWGQLGDGVNIGPEGCPEDRASGCSITPVPVSGISYATAIAVGVADACALLPTGSVDCWGEDSYGQLGDSADTDLDECEGGDPCSPNPVQIDGITDATGIAAGGGDICTLSPTGGVDCWGNNEYGQLGDGTTENSDVPVQVSGIE